MPQKLTKYTGDFACARCGARYSLLSARNLFCRLPSCARRGGRLVPFIAEQHFDQMRKLALSGADRTRPAMEGSTVAKAKKQVMVFEDEDGEELGVVAFPEGARYTVEFVDESEDVDFDLEDIEEDGDGD